MAIPLFSTVCICNGHFGREDSSDRADGRANLDAFSEMVRMASQVSDLSAARVGQQGGALLNGVQPANCLITSRPGRSHR